MKEFSILRFLSAQSIQHEAQQHINQLKDEPNGGLVRRSKKERKNYVKIKDEKKERRRKVFYLTY